jgi:hypothetical protein
VTTPAGLGIDAVLELVDGTDPRAPGGAVTVALCGSWEHEGACRWPHNSRLDSTVTPARLRTVVVVDDAERDDVIARVEAALRADEHWSVVSFAVGSVHADEHALAARMATPPT